MQRKREQYFYPKPSKRPGRKMMPGSLTWDPQHNIRGIFVGYCPNCNAKVVTEEANAKKLIARYCEDRNSFMAKLLRRWVSKRTI